MLLVTAGAVSWAQDASVDASLRGRRVYGAVQFHDSHEQEVLASLWDGLKAEISFQLRLYRRSRGLFSFLGDRLLHERRVEQIAFFDIYENRYKIFRDERFAGEYESETAFLEAFFSLPETELGRIEDPALSERGQYYLLARVRMMPVQLIAPLNIITLFSSQTVFTTPWVEAELGP